ncbi:MAG: glycoside hydrolase family 97 protein [Tannerellaceae bacterium]|jgi:alpha-glucosidase|nr:glycoside hydrolase family 97 protein [Tannerellaceae bacterium]
MKRKGVFFVLLSAILLTLPAWGQSSDVVLSSPDGNLSIIFRTAAPPRPASQANRSQSTPEYNLVYEVKYNNKPFIIQSGMGLELEGSRVLGYNVIISKSEFSEGEDRYSLLTGRTSAVADKYRSVLLDISEERGNRKMQIEARAYNDAVAFRYIVPEQTSLLQYRLISEKTEFRLPQDAMTYAQVLPNFRSGYESEFHKVPATGLANQGGVASRYLVGLPLVMEMPGVGWAAISEADLENNAGMYLMNPSGSWTGYWFESVIAPSLTRPEVAVVGTLPHKTAWRVIMAASYPGRFVETNILTNLNPECRISDTSWIQSGKSAWDWWNGSLNKEGEKAFTTETMKYYVDFAAESGLKYMTIDAGWSAGNIYTYRETLNVPEVVAYAKEKGVRVFVWAHSRNVWNQLDAAFPIYEQWGVSGVKIDFIERDDQAGIDFYYRVAEKAAKHKLMIDFHGCSKPWGIQRAYPNIVGYEAIIGMEQSKAGGRDNPENRLIIPFTRMIGGLTDYTPGGFDNVTREEFISRMQSPMVMGTRAHHLAIYVVYESPFQMVSDWPERYRNDPSFEFIKKVPASWDETRVLNGYPGEYITIARKRGDDWYLGAMTNWTRREFDLSLDFLGEGNYLAEIYADTSESEKMPKQINIKTSRVNSKSKLKLNLASAGGTAIHFKRVK